MTGFIRSYGPLQWLMPKFSPNLSWTLIGAIAAEDRCCTVPEISGRYASVKQHTLLRIADVWSGHLDIESRTRKAWMSNEAKLRVALQTDLNVRDEDLFCGIDRLIAMMQDVLLRSEPHILLDISALPKRFYFVILKHLLSSECIQTLVVTYTVPDHYDAKLCYDSSPWEALPQFGHSESEDVNEPFLIISVGYEVLQLIELIKGRQPSEVRLVLPFPSKPPGSIRNWDFVRSIHQQVEIAPGKVLRVPTNSMPLAFDAIDSQSAGHSEELILAPYGPKPIALAMALLAIKRQEQARPVSVVYTQPRCYSPNYSTGVETDLDGHPVVHAYCLKINGTNLYA